ncbi:hypothetical protein Acj9p099 [Acinetobacter phage Acj9]|uniref:Uncharacterized protein n=1 Tax=Acinetobacter phage Acj9 TaxID=760939 RepID=E5EPN3_9CAUD|nr:hypothetical protein Acj9p099 [Acinetobacter phage Acj9]ADG59999.1 hypothetical protein Acj9p099 [Acinetobacter phage Acj9]
MEELEMISNQGARVVELQARLFIVSEHLNGTMSLEWHPNILEAIKSNRYAPYFSAIDSLRTNAEKILNARATPITKTDMVNALLEQSVEDDLMINKLAFTCFIELGI